MKAFKFLIIIVLLISCSRKVPELSKSEIEFAGVLTDVYLVNGLVNQLNKGSKDSAQTQLMIQVLSKHKMDTTQFYETLYQFEKDPIKMKMIYDTVVIRLERLKK